MMEIKQATGTSRRQSLLKAFHEVLPMVGSSGGVCNAYQLNFTLKT